MKTEYFDGVVVPQAIVRTINVLKQKGEEYESNGDRLDNFYTSAIEAGEDSNPILELLNMARKHWTSLCQMARNPEQYPESLWHEKTVDLRNYTILLEALLIDMRKENV